MIFHTFTEQKLRQFTESVFLKMGCPVTDAQLAADVLLKSDLRGIDSHGVARLSGYVRLWEKERINAKPDVKVVHETATTATVDGDAGLGLVVAPFAMKVAIEKARIYGSGWVAVKNSNHFGIAGYHALMAVEQDMIGISMTNASPLVAPTYANERLLGTNPMCYAFPAGKYPPLVVDMATAAAANGKLEIAQRANQPIPEGWVQDKDGNSSTSAHQLKDGGSLLPLGSDKDHGSHKGYGLSATVDILSAVLSGANYGPWVPPFVAFLEPSANPVGEGIGHFFGAMRIDGFRPADDFKQHLDNWIERFKSAKTVDPNKKVIIPGEPEYAFEQERKIQGIPLIDVVVNDLNELAVKLGIERL
ncbi:Malate/lactate/ureidoglycolate dehydrogenase, LDH2 family [Pedobacter steynii]|uniref:Malate/lactate/ureidoglycolate dehydrogenase, LDH2 family n=1 Tax=Pedobacter steynii TaxID=430522 RepID=A0A1H0GND8_9SPHI|nr:Ldh family oxidoreductase [Pedobacter steynii]NQX42474.1 Ldh family oxidoreductase [Pedobacter steynii]SDO08414.1 Malate/lactate/ureidoglycolate dehydrogenase, LDH2 family [Pedobacter steynii]